MSDTITIIIQIITILLSSSVISSVVVYILYKSKIKAETSKIEIDVEKAKQSIIGDQVDQAGKIVEIATNLLQDVHEERDKLLEENKLLKEQNKKLEKLLDDCEQAVREWENKHKR